jgi:hypothetical protein
MKIYVANLARRRFSTLCAIKPSFLTASEVSRLDNKQQRAKTSCTSGALHAKMRTTVPGNILSVSVHNLMLFAIIAKQLLTNY